MRRAVILLWAALVLAILESVLDPEFATLEGEGTFHYVFWIAVGFSYALNGALIYFAWRRRNWARIALLVLTAGGLALMLYPWSDDYFAGWTPANILSAIAFTVMDLVALYWLFTGEARDWYRRPAA